MTFFEALTTLLSGAALLTSLVVLYLSDKRSIKTIKLANQANGISNKANQIAKFANQKAEDANSIAQNIYKITLHDHKVKILPEIVGYYIIAGFNIENPDTDLILLIIRNDSLSPVYIDSISVYGSSLAMQTDFVTFPKELLYHEDVEFPVLLSSVHRKRLVTALQREKEITFLPIDDAFALGVIKHIENSRFSITFRDSIDNKYISHLRFDSANKIFKGFVTEVRKDQS